MRVFHVLKQIVQIEVKNALVQLKFRWRAHIYWLQWEEAVCVKSIKDLHLSLLCTLYAAFLATELPSLSLGTVCKGVKFHVLPFSSCRTSIGGDSLGRHAHHLTCPAFCVCLNRWIGLFAFRLVWLLYAGFEDSISKCKFSMAVICSGVTSPNT